MNQGNKISVAVIFGGDNPESGSSLSSALEVCRALPKERYEAFLVELKRKEWRLADFREGRLESRDCKFNPADFSFAGDDGTTVGFDVALIAIHGYPGESGHVQGYLDVAGIPCAGSGVLASSLAHDKFRCKIFLSKALDLDVPQQFLIDSASLCVDSIIALPVSTPFIIKPNTLGSGFGVMKVNDISSLDDVCRLVMEFGSDAIVEQYVSGTEVTVGAIRTTGVKKALSVAEVRRGEFAEPDDAPSFEKFCSHRETQIIIPANISRPVELRLRKLILDIGEALDLKGCYRADFIVTRDGSIYFLEVNTIPGTSEHSVFTKQCRFDGIAPAVVFSSMIDDAL